MWICNLLSLICTKLPNWYLVHMRAAKSQASLHKCAASLDRAFTVAGHADSLTRTFSSRLGKKQSQYKVRCLCLQNNTIAV